MTENLDFSSKSPSSCASEVDSQQAYKVGYKKPPKNTQFKKGTSGNPAGRPKKRAKKALSTGDLFVEVFSAPVKVTVNGRTKQMTGVEAGLWQLKAKIMAGDLRAIRLYLEFCQRLGIADSSNELNPQLQALVDALNHGPVS